MGETMSKKWQYRTVSPASPHNMLELLNKHGGMGWECFCRERCPFDGTVVYFFKKQISQEKTTKTLKAKPKQDIVIDG